MHLGSKNLEVDYMMDSITLDTVTEEKDLGVLIDEEQTFYKHVSATVSKANQILGIVKRIFDTLDKELLPIVWKHQVRPHFEYGNVIWYPHYIVNMKKIEGVKRRATKLIRELKDKPYQERLKFVFYGI